MFNNILLIYILLIVIFESAAQGCLKKYSESNNFNYFYIGIFFYIGVGLLLCETYNNKGSLGFTNVIWSGISIVASTMVGILLFKEKFHLHDLLATLLIATGIFILKFTN